MYHHYNTNRQRKQVLCRFFAPANSLLRTTEKYVRGIFILRSDLSRLVRAFDKYPITKLEFFRRYGLCELLLLVTAQILPKNSVTKIKNLISAYIRQGTLPYVLPRREAHRLWGALLYGSDRGSSSQIRFRELSKYWLREADHAQRPYRW